MSADRQNLTVYAGDDLVLAVTIKGETGAPLSISGATFVWKMAATAGGTATITKSSGSGITITNSAIGAVSITLSHTDTTGLSGPMWHQLVMTDVNGLVSTVTTGTITFSVRT